MTAVVELAQPRTLLPRWTGHGDLTVIADGPITYLRADQVEELAGITPWDSSTCVPKAPRHIYLIDGVPFYSSTEALEAADNHGTQLAEEFAAWLRDFLAGVDDVVLEHAHKVVPFIEAHTVANAAALLNDDPTITIGRDRLFAVMEQLGWIERNDAAHDWVLTKHAHDRDYLTLRPVNVPAATRAGARRYLQVHVTQAGLTALRASLYALGRGDPATGQAPLTPLF